MAISNYLIIDYGNSRIKACAFDRMQNSMLENVQVKAGSSAQALLDQMTTLKDKFKVEKVVMSITAKPEVSQPFVDELKKILGVDVKVIGKQDFTDIIDFRNIDKNVVIGSDLLLMAAYGIYVLNSGAIISLGTVYTVVIFNHSQIVNVLLIPSIVRGMNQIPDYTAIDKGLLPQEYKTTRGLNTPDAFSAGANWAIEGLADNIVRQYSFLSNSVVVTGGDAPKFSHLIRKYKNIPNLVIIAICELLKYKCW